MSDDLEHRQRSKDQKLPDEEIHPGVSGLQRTY